jgi:serine/threonine-protein kinase
VLASLNHPNIAHIYGVERADGTTALAMELVEGPTLAERIAQGRIPVDEALRLATQIADALEAAHERGIVHRDLKPANIKVRPDGTVKVLDFGIAKALDTRTTVGRAALTTPAMTEAGIVLGTAAYMSPEQARGKPVDQRADIWAFGCLLYEMLTGQPAFLGEDVTTTLARVLQGSADVRALPAEVSAPVRRTLELCFEKDARKRIADMRDVKLALAGAFTTGAAAPKPTLWRFALPGGLLVAGLLGGIYLSRLGAPQAPVAPAELAAPLPVSRFVITPPATAPLASQGGLDVTISPDGKRIAYVVQKPDNGNIELYVRELDELESRPIAGTERPAGGPANPFFSPDGKSVGFSAATRGIVVAAVDGRPSIKLLDPPQPGFNGAWWSADNTIIYSSARRLQRVSAGGAGTPEPLMPERESGYVAAPVLLPGGHAVLYHASDAAGDRVAVLDLDTGKEKIVVDGGSNPAYVDTGHVVFARGDTLMAVPFKASELAVTGEPVALVQGIRRAAAGAADYALSANGTLVYVPGTAQAVSNAAVVWVDRTGKVTGRAVPDLVASPRDPRLSPDGKRLLLVTGAFADGDLWSYDLGGRPPIPLALPSDNRLPVWSLDGKRVAFFSATGALEVFTTFADGSTLAPQSLHIQRAAPQVWSADGELILVSFAGGAPDIVAAPAAGTGEVRKVVASEFSEFDPALSPNGRWLAYVSNRTGQDEIWVQGYPDGVPVRVSSNGGYEPLWSADGRELFYRQGSAMMATSVETGSEFSFAAPKQLFSGEYSQSPAGNIRGYDVARDGRFLMILAQTNESRVSASESIVVVQNFTEELKQRVRPSGR